MPDQPYIAAVKLPNSKETQMVAFASRVGRESFLAAIREVEPRVEAITSEIPKPIDPDPEC